MSKVRKGIIIFLCIFFTSVSSIAVHEYVHVLQYTSAGFEVEEVCLLSYQDGKAGWVKLIGGEAVAFGEIHEDELELQAYAISTIYFIVIFLLLIHYLLKEDEDVWKCVT